MSLATYEAVEAAIREHIAADGAHLDEWLLTVSATKPDGRERHIWAGSGLGLRVVDIGFRKIDPKE